MPENYNVQLFVGFGGSGGKTLARFAELATQNNEWAKKAAKEIYFLLCDTDQSELEESHAAITKSFKNINPKPVIKVLQLGDGIPSMESHIAQVFRDTDSDGIDRLSKHWWVNDEGIPFKASALAMPPANGAGQCPAVAHFLAWNKSPELKSLINDIIQEILTRTATGGGAPNVAVTFVASLAGGTGRGCWPLLALMLREELRQRKHHCFPQGYFFDQSCFQQVMAANPGQKSQLMVNSLTGLSELIAWIRNDSPDVQNPIEYTLPHMRNPQESSQDVIDIQLDNFSADAKGKSPLNHAWMIFRESKSGALAKTEDYYHMVASCLYTQAATGIASREANDRMAFGSAGAAVCRIKIREIREYLKNKTISQLCKNLQSPDSGDSIDMQSKWDFTDFAESFGRENNDSGTIIEKINYYVNDGISPKRLIDAMKKQDVKKALRFASQLDTPDDELIQEACFKAFKITNTKDTATTSGDLIKRAMLLRVQSDVLEKCMYLEAGSVKRICEGLQNKMMESAKALGQIANANTRSTKIHDSVDDVKGRALKDGLKPFSDAEIEEVKRSIPNNYIDACRSKVAELLSDACNATAAKLNMMTDNVELALSELAAAAIIYDDEVAEVEPGLFTIRKDGKWSVDDEHARDIFDETRFTERILRPALDEDESSQEEDLVHIDQIVEAIISQESVDNHFSELKNNLLGAKLLQSEITDVDRADFRRKLRTGLEELYDKISVEENVLVRNFSFATVIKGLRKAWSQRMLGVPEGPERDQLANRFEAEFGLKLETEADGSLVVPTLESMLVHLTISIAKTCDAYFRLVDEGGQDTLDRPAVTLPENEHVFTDNLISRMKDPALLRSANILPEGFTPSRGSDPYMISCITQTSSIISDRPALSDIQSDAPFHNIRSMRYWSDDTNCLAWLRLAENESGTSFFKGIGPTFGLGYSDPRFVREPNYRNKRWKPWAIDTSALSDSYDAALYCLRGSIGETTSAEDAKNCKSAIAEVAREYPEWTFPIANDEQLTLTRCLMCYDEQLSAVAANTQRHWSAGKQIGTAGKLERLFSENNDIVKQVLVEQDLFNDKLLGNNILHPWNASLDKALLDYLNHWKNKVSSLPGSSAALFSAYVGKLIERHRQNM